MPSQARGPSAADPAAGDYLQELLERGNRHFARGDVAEAIAQYETALTSFVQTQHLAVLRSIYQTIWANKAMAHQQLGEHGKSQEAAMIANALAQRLESERVVPVTEQAAARHCRRCGASLATASGEAHPSLEIARCARCEYRNVLACSNRTIPLQESLEHAGLGDLGTKLMAKAVQSGDVREMFQTALEALIAQIVEWIDREYEAAGALIWHNLQHVEDTFWRSERDALGSDVSRSVHTKSAALLAVLASRRGPPEIDAVPDLQQASIEIRERAWTVATEAGTIGGELKRLLRGENEARVEEGAVTMVPSPYYLQVAEWRINRHHDYSRREKRWDEELDLLFDRVLEQTRGYTLQEFVAFQEVIAQQVRQYFPPGERLRLMWPRRSLLSDRERAMLDDWTLSTARVVEFSEPFYFDLGTRARKAPSDVEIGVSLAVHSWSAYFPIVPVRRNGHEHYLIPVRTMGVGLENLSIFKSRLMELLFQSQTDLRPREGAANASRRKGRDLGPLRVKANRLAERRAAADLREAGWVAVSGCTIADLPDTGPAEEIDLIAARQIGERTVLLVGEVKDFDLGLHRTSAKGNFQRRVEDACRQLKRKALLAERVWETILCDPLGLAIEAGAPVDLLSLLVTSEYLPLALFERCAVLCIADLRGLSDRLSNEPEILRQQLAQGWKALR